MRNRISYLEFKERLSLFGVFSALDVIKAFPEFDKNRFSEWQNKGYISKLIKGWYIFNDTPNIPHTLFIISNMLCRPSYVSMESALSYYGAIPEQAFTVTAITTTKTQTYDTPKGHFSYQKIKANLFFGYNVIPQASGRPVLIATIEKALLDYLYLNPQLNDTSAIAALRLNKDVLHHLDIGKMDRFASLFNNGALNIRYQILKQWMQ
jgi:predicted transcriptional regulator of viral defense system